MTARATFSWEIIERAVPQLPGGRGLNIAYTAVDVHDEGARRGHLAARLCGYWGGPQSATCSEAKE